METSSHYRKFDKLSEKLGFRFRKPELLMQAFMHSSYVNEQADPILEDNERLEFLGDAVLDLAISHFLMIMFENAKEGDLSKFRASIVNERGLFSVAETLNLGDHILLGKGEELTRGREKPSILANTMEALIGAIYLDAGFDKAKEIIERLFMPQLEKIDHSETVDDYKSLLQEYTQEVYKTRPEYLHVKESGPANDRIFMVALRINGKIFSEGEGGSKKAAEQKAAKEAFFCLTKDQKTP